MATIQLQCNAAPTGKPTGQARPKNDTATVSASPGRHYYGRIAGKLRTFERVGVDPATNQEIYRDQNRRG